MNILSLSEQVSISNQIEVVDLDTLLNNDIEILICNRHDNEAQDQTNFDVIASEAKKIGITAIHLPFMATDLTQETINRFKELLASNKKIHAYCRTGNRCQLLWNESKYQLSLNA